MGDFIGRVAAVILLGDTLAATAANPIVGQNPVPANSPGIIQSSSLIGTPVLNPQSQKLGQIKDVVLDQQTGQATFVVLDAIAGGSNHAMLVVPYQALWVTSNPVDKSRWVMLDLRPEQLAAAPQIRDNKWDMLQNSQFLDQARNFYQVRTYTAAKPIEEAGPPAPSLSAAPPAPAMQYAMPCALLRGSVLAAQQQPLRLAAEFAGFLFGVTCRPALHCDAEAALGQPQCADACFQKRPQAAATVQGGRGLVHFSADQRCLPAQRGPKRWTCPPFLSSREQLSRGVTLPPGLTNVGISNHDEVEAKLFVPDFFPAFPFSNGAGEF